MKRTFYLVLSTALLGLYSCNNSENKEDDALIEKQGQEHKMNVEKSQIRWFGEKLKNDEVVGSHNGTLQLISGSIFLNNGIISGGEFVIDMNTMNEDGKDLDREMTKKLIGHLLSEDFFETEKYPTASLVIKSANKEAIQGTLTVKGIEMDVDIPITVTVTETNVFLGGVFDLDFSAFRIPGLGGSGEYISNKIGFRVFLDFAN